MSPVKAAIIWKDLYLSVYSFIRCWDGVVTLVFMYCTQQTHTLLISTTENIDEFPVLRAGFAVEIRGWIRQLVFPPPVELVVFLQVRLAVRGETGEAGSDGFARSRGAGVTAHIFINLSLCSSHLHQLLGKFLHVEPVNESRSVVKSVFALRASAHIPIPHTCNAVRAETVSTGNNRWISEEIQTNGASKRFPIEWNFICHFAALKRHHERISFVCLETMTQQAMPEGRNLFYYLYLRLS